MYRDESADPPALVCQVGSTTLKYHLQAIDDLHEMLREHGDWTPLGAADEQKTAADDTVGAWGRSEDNPADGQRAQPEVVGPAAVGVIRSRQRRCVVMAAR